MRSIQPSNSGSQTTAAAIIGKTAALTIRNCAPWYTNPANAALPRRIPMMRPKIYMAMPANHT